MEELTDNLSEIEAIELDEVHHDFGGAEANLGNDFAHFWLMVRLLDVETSGATDYMFVCEYVQDIAEFDSSNSPTAITLYQLKKKVGSHWGTADLTGQTLKSKKPNAKKPIVKLFKSVRAFKTLKAKGAFISNAKFSVPLKVSGPSTKSDVICLADLDATHGDALCAGLAVLEGIAPAEVDLSTLEMRSVPLSVDDLHRHTTGIMFAYLETKAPRHANQASSLVDTIYLRLRSSARVTNVSKNWAELVERRGFGKLAFQQALMALKSIPDAHEEHMRLLDKLAKDWSSGTTIKVRMALSDCYRDKVLTGTGNRWHIDRQPIQSIFDHVSANDLPDDDFFQLLTQELAAQLPHLKPTEIKALAIYEMVELWT